MGMNNYNLHPPLVFVKYFPIKTLGQATAVAMDANHPHAMVIPDVYHMYISEGGFESLKMLKGNAIARFQFNDAPASPSLPELGDHPRVFTGDRILPLPAIPQATKPTGLPGFVSLD